LQRIRGPADAGKDDIRASRDQLRGISAHARDVVRTPESVDAHIATVGPPQFLQALHKGREASLRFRLVGGRAHENANTPHSLSLLRACHDRPRRRTANQRDELAPSHGRRPRDQRQVIVPASTCALEGLPMSALGQKPTYALQQAMSALHPIATAKADFRKRSCLLTLESGHVRCSLGCRLWANSGH